MLLDLLVLVLVLFRFRFSLLLGLGTLEARSYVLGFGKSCVPHCFAVLGIAFKVASLSSSSPLTCSLDQFSFYFRAGKKTITAVLPKRVYRTFSVYSAMGIQIPKDGEDSELLVLSILLDKRKVINWRWSEGRGARLSVAGKVS